eukprot:11731644-Alexandrium_andersonii.AAC.1
MGLSAYSTQNLRMHAQRLPSLSRAMLQSKTVPSAPARRDPERVQHESHPSCGDAVFLRIRPRVCDLACTCLQGTPW